MGDSTLYDDDILLWSEQQAAAIRRLREPGRIVANELDVDNVAEEIEAVGRSELAAVESFVELVLVHLIKLIADPEAPATRHWRGEIAGFHSGLKRRFAPSMRHRIDMDGLWADARAQMTLAGDAAQQAVLVRLPESCPVALDDLLGERIDPDALAADVRGALRPEEG